MNERVKDIINENLQDEIEAIHHLEQAICYKIEAVSKKEGESTVVTAWNILTALLPEYKAFKTMGIKPSSARGLLAEIMLKYILETWAKDRGIEYVYYNNLLIPRADGGTTQLDGVFITNSFAIVVECKSYYGKLTVADGKILSKTNKATPWRQNYGHIMSLKKLLGDKAKIYFHNLVYIFSEGVIVDYEEAPEEYLMVNKVAMSTLDKLNSNANFKNALTTGELKEIADELQQYIPTVEEEEEHIQFVNTLIS